MVDRIHPDEIDRVRFALWGPTDAGTLAAASHAGVCDDCREDADRLERVSEIVRRIGLGPSEASREAIATILAEADAQPVDVSWLTATPTQPVAGLRAGSVAERVLTCVDGDLRIDALVHPGSGAGPTSISGQARVDGAEPATPLVITVFLDRRPGASVRTDEFGEFSFRTSAARRIGVRVAGHGSVRHVELLAGDGTR